MRIIKFIDKFLNFIVIMFFIIVIAFSAYAFYDIRAVYEEAKLSDDILKYKPAHYQEDNTEKFNLSDLQNNINEDICGWIRIDDTNIDYPILFPHTSLEYLDKDYKKNYTPGGSIFIDYTNDRYFKDDYTVIYGHNMNEKMMFSDVKLFKEQEYFEKHKTGKLYTSDAIYNIKIYTFNILDSNKDIAYDVQKQKNGNNAKLISSFEKSAIFKNEIEVTADDQLIILTTCNGVGTPERAVLFCKIEKIDESDSINEETNSNIEKDEKKKEKEKFEKEEKTKIKKMTDELSRDNYKTNQHSKSESKFAFYLNRLLNDPVKLSLYILILITIIIYAIIIIKRLKQRKQKKNKKTVKRNTTTKNKPQYTQIEQINRRRINELRNKNKIVIDNDSDVAKSMFKVEGRQAIVEVKHTGRNIKRRNKGKHSK